VPALPRLQQVPDECRLCRRYLHHGICGAAGTIRARATFSAVSDTYLRYINFALDCQNARNRQCAVTSGCSASLGSDCAGRSCDSGEECWVATTRGASSSTKTVNLTAALGCPHAVCFYPASYPGYTWSASLEINDGSSWVPQGSDPTMTGWDWLCAEGVSAR